MAPTISQLRMSWSRQDVSCYTIHTFTSDDGLIHVVKTPKFTEIDTYENGVAVEHHRYHAACTVHLKEGSVTYWGSQRDLITTHLP